MIDGGLNGSVECGQAEEEKEPLATKIAVGILYTALLLAVIALLVLTLGPVLISIGTAVAAGAVGAVKAIGAGAALVISFVALPAFAVNEPRPPLRRRPDGSLEPPGNCTPSQYSALKAAEDAACAAAAGLTCRGLDPGDIPCSNIKSRIDAFGACIAARQAVMLQCFEGGNAGHWEIIANLQTAAAICQSLYAAQNCDNCP